ncbi:hypothetical protein J8I26_08480 [Herbaspirillum sp. LeCh32-8]|uniref:hypothetical protein n=1 Tax=Herbaspirillum sp. LeCh32-8 TaxID=2821356 RepID=UPI001AEB8583|nr:hypothetical protein [Herbaspirillum sp. LeCh32-8]MBP0598134.1 hypothetical protein [Herbaspirillum sp. LeCh32-8]
MREAHQPAGGTALSAAFREFDLLWEKARTPETAARMEAILREIGDTFFLDAIEPAHCAANDA